METSAINLADWIGRSETVDDCATPTITASMTATAHAVASVGAIAYLFVPGNRPERFAKALAAGADRVIVDLEDAVAPADKASARSAIAQWLQGLGSAARASVLVRINDALSPWYADDLAMLREAGALSVMLPKCEAESQVAEARAALAPGGLVVPLIETARGLVAVHSIASAPGIERLAFGSLDYMLDLDLPGEGVALDFAAAQIALASRAAGLMSPVAGVTPALDAPRVIADMQHARALGFGAKMCIHPMQVLAVRTALAPSADELAWARRVLAAWQDNSRPGDAQGAIRVDGKMVDKPVVLKAERILACAPPG